jgi:ABC-2 type transport system permease protein
MRRSLVITKYNLRLLLSDPGPIFIFILTPLLLMAILKPAQSVLLHAEGFAHANGSEQIVPSFTGMFSFFWVGYIGRSFFAEHGWGTWERLQTTVATRTEIMVGKLAPAFLLIALQQVVVFGAGALLFGLPMRGGRVLELAIVDLPLIACVLTLTLTLVSLLGTLAQMDAAAAAIQMGFATLGGALVPSAALPSLARSIGYATPLYWPLHAARSVILEGKGLSVVLISAGILLGFSALLTVIAATRFSFGESKSVAV